MSVANPIQSIGTIHAASPVKPPDKIIVAVHGIGDQVVHGTVQGLVHTLCQYLNHPKAVPLGSFAFDPENDSGVWVPRVPRVLQLLQDQSVAFAEIYWANICREVVTNGYTLEETKLWATTVVERLAMAQQHAGYQVADEDKRTLKNAISQLIEVIKVLENLLTVTRLAGFGSFELYKVLSTYLGDVQIVSEFTHLREKILEVFLKRLWKIHSAYPMADIYLVAHSEGSVVTFLGLLYALVNLYPQPNRQPRTMKPGQSIWLKQAPWLDKVKGLMTIGSPIDKHLLLWPELWDGLGCPPDWTFPDVRIPWHNYFDYGDPIGSRLDVTRDWLQCNHWEDVFHFPDNQDYNFYRYTLPVQAHNDYWNDDAVVGHYAKHVMKVIPKTNPGNPPNTRYDNPRANHGLAAFTSYTLPYLLPLLFLSVGVYFLYQTVVGFAYPNWSVGLTTFFDVIGLTCLIAAVTVCTGICRVALFKWRVPEPGSASQAAPPKPYRVPNWHWIGWGFFVVVLGVGCYWAIGNLTQQNLSLGHSIRVALGAAHSHDEPAKPTDPEEHYTWQDGVVIPVLALVFAAVICLIYLRKPTWGLWPQQLLGLLVVVLVIAAWYVDLYYHDNSKEWSTFWPVLLGGAAFFYLWWLAALTFDLVVIWHEYFRREAFVKLVKRTLRTSTLKREQMAPELPPDEEGAND